MKNKFLSYIVYSLFFITYLLIVPRTFAANEFQTDYDLQYAINPTGVTTVTQKITFTNVLPNFYPQKYALLIDSDKITNIVAYDDEGVITPGISTLDGKTQISLVFNAKNVGLGKTTHLTLRYTHEGIAEKNGAIWEIYIPGVVNDPDIDRYDVTLHVPDSFGPLAYLSPRPSKGTATWDREQMIRGGVAGAYGTNQIYTLDLSYELFNTTSRPVRQQIALPPDTARQKIIIDTLDPNPETVTKDADGNWLATYGVPANSSVAIKAHISAYLYLYPRDDFPKSDVDMTMYIQPQDYWESTDPTIATLAKTLDTPRKIYDYVVEILEYDLPKNPQDIKRLGAKQSLIQPTSTVCMEFTDLFIAIARAAHIPARRLVGYAYTNNTTLRPVSLVTDVLHAWPEYYDGQTKQWIPIDPTWADTTGGLDYFDKLDFNHIVFAIHGANSSLPYPAGFYHDPAVDQKDVAVSFAQVGGSITSNTITTAIIFPDSVTAGLGTRGTVVLRNTSGQVQRNIPYDAKSTIGGIVVADTIAELLPYQQFEIPISGTMPFLVKPAQADIRVSVAGAQYRKPFTVVPYILYVGLVLGILIISSFFIFRKKPTIHG